MSRHSCKVVFVGSPVKLKLILFYLSIINYWCAETLMDMVFDGCETEHLGTILTLPIQVAG